MAGARPRRGAFESIAGVSRAEHPRSRAERPRSHAEHPRSHAQRHLFLAGCPRSGTSALAFLLNEHPRLAIGFERFKRVRAQLDPFQFTPAQFFAPVTAETDIRGELLYARLRARWESGTVGVVGDKVPLYTRVLPQLLARFPAARVVVIVRDPLAVARSFRRRAADPEDWWPVENDHRLAIAMWNEALSCVREVQASWGGEGEEEGRAALLPYDALFAGDERWLGALCGFIGVPLTARLRAEHRRLALAGSERASESKPQAHVRTPESDRALDAASEPAPEPDHMSDSELEAYVRAHVDRDLEAWAHERMERQLRTIAPAGAPDPGEDEPPLSAGEVEEREREREQLLAQMRRPGRRGVDELEVLERRFVEQAGELARRGERLARPPGPGVPKPRITFVLPHQRATTGGVYVIEQFARHLASVADVSLAVREPALRPVAGVEVLAVERLEGPALPRADVLVYPADLRDGGAIFGLPARTGRPVMLFQGYGTPGSPVVEANLARAAEAVAVARWLHDLALGRGIPCAYVPEGLDRGVFSPGPPQSERPPRISLMTHRLDWKGLADALAAVAIVRARRPEVKLALFGTEPLRDAAGGDGVTAVGGATTFLASPTRPQVAELLRASAVHVLASWEEGFGLTGAEAIACGAALATTDTKGSRDYAIDGHTALVSAPRDPAALARNVLALLDDAPLRARLVGAGQRHLRTAMPPWQEAARRLAFALLEA